jgi:hypothetical protein
VNRFIIEKARAIENPTVINPELMNGYNDTDIAILQDQIEQALEKAM